MAHRLTPGDRVAVTGAAGFIGSAVVRRLMARSVHVVAMVEPHGDRSNLLGPDVDPSALEIRPADVRDSGAVTKALDGCRFVVHAAALYGFWSPDPAAFGEINVQGTRHVLAAAAAQGCERVVYTSTVGTLGLDGTENGRAATEESLVDVAHLFGRYKQTKYVAEHEALRAAAEGLDVSLVLPTFPLGPRDRRPTPTGKVVLDFLNGRLPGYVDTVLNVAHVDDLAEGHVLALEQGRRGRRYILGGDNLPMRALLAELGRATGLPVPTLRVPRALALAAGLASDVVEGRLLRRHPSVPLEAARMSATHMRFDDARARTELGYRSRPAAEAVVDSARWFLAHGYVKPARAAKVNGPGRPD